MRDKPEVLPLHHQTKPVRAVDRALDLLALFLETDQPLGVAAAGRAVGIPKSTAYRLLCTLEAKGFLQRVTPGERFALGPRLRPTRSGSQPATPDLRAAATPVMEGLRDTCGETVGLHELIGDERLCIAAAEGVRNLRTSGRIGSRAPLYSGASARAMLAFLPESRWEEVIARTGLVPLTPNTITDPDRLRAELRRIRQKGYAVSDSEWEEGITSVAAPLFGPGGTVTGSINLSGPSFRFTADKIRLLVGALTAAANVISQRLQAKGGGPL